MERRGGRKGEEEEEGGRGEGREGQCRMDQEQDMVQKEVLTNFCIISNSCLVMSWTKSVDTSLGNAP